MYTMSLIKAVWIFIFFVVIDAAFLNEPENGTVCKGSIYKFPWDYSIAMEDAFSVVWSKDGGTVLTWFRTTTAYSYGTGYSADKVQHNNNNGEITILSLTSSDAGTYICTVTYMSGATTTSNDTILFTLLCQQISKNSDVTIQGVSFQTGWSILIGILSGINSVRVCLPVILKLAKAKEWYFSRRYVFCGTVVYGLQIAIIAALIQLVDLIAAVFLLSWYAGQYDGYVYAVILFPVLLYPCLGVGIYLLIVTLWGPNDWIHFKFHSNSQNRSLSKEYGVKFATITGSLDRILFKVKAEKDVHMALKLKDKLVEIRLDNGNPPRSVILVSSEPNTTQEFGDRVLSHAEYKTFYLTYDDTIITLFNGENKCILKLTNVGFPPFDISDIVIMPVIEAENPRTTQKWIFWFRPGDDLIETTETSRDGLNEDEGNSRISQTVMLFSVVVIPIAWVVLLFLKFRRCKGRKIDNQTKP